MIGKSGVINPVVTIHTQRKQIIDLVCDYQDVFADEQESLGRTSTIRHKINTGAAKPIKQAPRRLPQAKREIIETEIDKMLKQGIIEPSTSSWSSPVVLVEKKNGSQRSGQNLKGISRFGRVRRPPKYLSDYC